MAGRGHEGQSCLLSAPPRGADTTALDTTALEEEIEAYFRDTSQRPKPAPPPDPEVEAEMRRRRWSEGHLPASERSELVKVEREIEAFLDDLSPQVRSPPSSPDLA